MECSVCGLKDESMIEVRMDRVASDGSRKEQLMSLVVCPQCGQTIKRQIDRFRGLQD